MSNVIPFDPVYLDPEDNVRFKIHVLERELESRVAQFEETFGDAIEEAESQPGYFVLNGQFICNEPSANDEGE